MTTRDRSSTTTDPRLLRAYRRLLLAYPPGPRRGELLDTLVESAGPGRRRPGLREVVNLTWHGSRARLGRPKSRGIVVLTLFLALAGGILGTGVSQQLGWAAARTLPTGAEAAAINETIFPGLPVLGGGDAPGVVSQADGEGLEYGYAVSWVRSTPATRDVVAYTAGVRSRLVAAGWTVTSVDPPLETNYVNANSADRSESFTATRGRLGVRFNDNYWPGRPAYDGDGNASFYLWQDPPPWLAGATWAGFLPGAFIVWLLTGWASRRLEPHPVLSTPAGAGAVLAVLCVVPAALIAVLSGGQADETVTASWPGLVVALRVPAMLFGVLAALLLVVAAVQRPPRRLPQWRRQAAAAMSRLGSRPRTALALATVLSLATGLGIGDLVTRHLMPGSCTPSVPVGIVDSPAARSGDQARVFISARATEDERNLAEAAIWRGMGGSPGYTGDPGSDDFHDAYCGRGRLTADAAAPLPRFWTVELTSPGLFGGLAEEMMAMPAVVAVQHLPA